MLRELLFIIYFFLPAGVANMAPVLAAHWRLLPRLDRPIDGGRKFKGKRIFGDHKTWRGFAAGFVAATVVVILQYLAYIWFEPIQTFSLVDYRELNIIIWSLALTLGALGGDAIKSFFKRQAGKPPGASWPPFDQIDYVLGTIVVSYFIYPLETRLYLMALIIGLALHPLVNLIAWTLKLQEEPI